MDKPSVYQEINSNLGKGQILYCIHSIYRIGPTPNLRALSHCEVETIKIFSQSTALSFMLRWSRAQPDITSGQEVRQIFKIRPVRKPDVFLPGRRTFKNRKKNQKKKFKKKFLNFFLFWIFFPFLKVWRPGRKTSSFRTVRILKICRTSGPDVMSG